MFDIISIGDCTIDHYFKISDAHLFCNVDKTKCELCFKYADKIPVEHYSQAIAGNNANNAVGSARLGLNVAIYTNIGSDLDGQKIIKKFKEEGIDTKYITANPDSSSNASAVISFKGERTILVYHQTWHYQLPDLERTKWVYLSSMSASFTQSNVTGQLENYLERTGSRLAFNPGTYQLKHGIKKYPKLLSLVTVLIVNEKEALTVLEIEQKETNEIKKLLQSLADLGPKMIVITQGVKGSFGFDGKSFYQMDCFPAQLVEMTGAGDAYATALVASLIKGNDLAESLRWGAANSASVIEHIGAQAGLLTEEQIQQRLKENPQIVAKKI